MSDLVDRLRGQVDVATECWVDDSPMPMLVCHELGNEAADEIERLQEETILFRLVQRERDEYRAAIQAIDGVTSDPDLWGALVKQRDKASAEIERLQAIVAKLPKTADGVSITPGIDVWCNGHVQYHNGARMDQRATRQTAMLIFDSGGTFIGECYSTQAAAEAAEART